MLGDKSPEKTTVVIYKFINHAKNITIIMMQMISMVIILFSETFGVSFVDILVSFTSICF